MATCKYSFNALVSFILNTKIKNNLFYLKRRASSSAAVASTGNQKNVPQIKTGPFGIPQRINLPKESVNVGVKQKRIYLNTFSSSSR
jgi:hypothetical protein